MKKLFISQPMKGKTDEEIHAERENAIRAAVGLIGEEVEVIDSFLQGTNLSPLECLGESLKLLATADVVYFAPGWNKARGCLIEHECCEQYGVIHICA